MFYFFYFNGVSVTCYNCFYISFIKLKKKKKMVRGITKTVSEVALYMYVLVLSTNGNFSC